ncbi:ComF family protein [Devosia sp.]|uniref:ComF family protein n=1 Tax=Devosia sp. TaxID=1871048 RepID=UPI003A8E0F4D
MEGESGVVKAGLAWLAAAGRGALDLVYPPSCIDCGAPVADANALCAACFAKLRPISAPMCPVLGIPFEVSPGPGALSAEAIADPPPYGRARSAVIYNAVARAIVGRLKYGDRPELAGFCARLMAQAGAELWESGPVLVPVPLHAARQFSRRYNQSTELARALGRLVGLSVDPALVKRTRRTRQQVGLSAQARERNVSGAFATHPEALTRLRGRGVVLCDDVITTGSTVKAVTRALNRAGVHQIDVISFGRVVVGVETPI